MGWTIGVDVGGTTSTIAVGNHARAVDYVSDHFATRSVEGPQATIQAIAEHITGGLAEIGVALEKVVAVGRDFPERKCCREGVRRGSRQVILTGSRRPAWAP